MLLDVPHGKGTITFGNGFGGGIQRPEKNDKYEGEFDTGFAHGLAQYTHTSRGKLFKGEYNVGQRHGCGAEYDMTPFLNKLKKGVDPETAWEDTKGGIESKAKLGTWLRDAFFTGPDESGRWCHIKEIQGTVQEVDDVVTKVKMFQFKPDGEVTLRMARDGQGFPAPLMQDPVHYPHGSAFLAPGPLGLCHGVPGDGRLRGAMAAAARVQERVHEMYNLPEGGEGEVGGVMEKAMKAWRRKVGRREKKAEKRLLREQQKLRRVEVEEDAGAEEDHGGGEVGGDVSEEDLVASVGLGVMRGVRALGRQWEAFHRGVSKAGRRRALGEGR